MRDSLMPPRGSGSKKTVVVLLVSGTIIMLIAAFFVLKQRGETAAPSQKAAPKTKNSAESVPTVSLVAPRPSPQPSETKDAGDAQKKEAPPTKSKKKKRGRAMPGGKIDAKQVNSFINARFSQVKACYERRLKVNAFLEGKLDLNIGVLESGKVHAITVNKNSVRDAQMLSCVKSTIRGWKFPKPEGGRVVIGKTFNFKKKGI